jgi:hypothetical protein
MLGQTVERKTTMNKKPVTTPILCAVLFGFCLLGCNFARLAQSVPTPTPPPDRIATGVAEARAISATLTAKVPTSSPTPLATETDVPTAVPTEAAEPAVSTEAPQASANLAPTTTPTAAPSPTPFQPVFGDVYGIQVIKAEKTKSYIYSQNGFIDSMTPKPGNIFLEVDVVIYKSGAVLWDAGERLNVLLRDAADNLYQIDNRDVNLIGVDISPSGNVVEKDYVLYFSVPDTAAGFRLMYRNLPAIDLGQ